MSVRPNTVNVLADWLVCLWIFAGGEGSHYQPLRLRGEGLWESSGWRTLSTRDFHSYFFSFKGRLSVWWMVVMKWMEILIFNFRISIWRFPCQNQCCHATRTDPAVLIMILTRRWTSTALWSDKSDKSHWHCYRWNISSPTSTTSNILLLIGWSSVRKLEIWQPRVNWSSETELSGLHF